MRTTGRVIWVLLGLLVLAAAATTAWLLAARESPWSAASVLTVTVGWVLWRVARLNTAGVMLWGLAVVGLSVLTWAPQPVKGDGLMLLPVGSALASSVVFLVAAVLNPWRRVRNCAGCNLALFTLIAWAVVSVTIRNHAYRQTAAKESTETLISLHKLGAEVEAIRVRIGRLPKDQGEFAALRGKPLPDHFVYYAGDAERHYHLSSHLNSFWGGSWDIFGWIVFYRGPNAPQPFWVTPF